MNLGLRAILYTVRKWKKTLLVFCLILSISTLVLSGLAIADAQEEQTEEVRGTTGASFTVQRDISTGGWSSGSGGSYSTQEFMTEDMIREIASVDGIQGYDASLITLPRIFNADGEELEHENYSFYNYGSYNSQYHELFLSGRFELVEGTHITDDMTGSIIISRELAEWNGLKVGDTLTGVYYPENNTPEVDMEIVGIFDVVADKGLNAFSVGSSDSTAGIVLTQGLLDGLSRQELEAVLAHETAHLRNGDVKLMMAGLSSALLFSFLSEVLFLMAFNPKRGGVLGAVVGVLLGAVCAVMGWVALPLMRLALSRTAESNADAEAVLLCRNPQALIRALEKISKNSYVSVLANHPTMVAMCIAAPREKNSLVLSLTGFFSTHPPIEKRIAALRMMDGTL